MKGRVYRAFQYKNEEEGDDAPRQWGVQEQNPVKASTGGTPFRTVATGLNQVQAEEVATLLSGIEGWINGPTPEYWGSRPLVLYFPDGKSRDNFKSLIDLQFGHIRTVPLDET